MALNIHVKPLTPTEVPRDLKKEASLFSVAGTPIENVLGFTYPGHDISNNDEKCYMHLRVSRATGKFSELYGVLTNKSVKKETIRKFLESCVGSRLIYMSQAILPKSPEMTKLESCQYNYLRRMMLSGFSKKLKTTAISHSNDQVRISKSFR